MTRSSHDERVRTRAYHLWEEAGRPHGRDQEFWARAAEMEQVSIGAGTTAHPALPPPDATEPLATPPRPAGEEPQPPAAEHQIVPRKQAKADAAEPSSKSAVQVKPATKGAKKAGEAAGSAPAEPAARPAARTAAPTATQATGATPKDAGSPATPSAKQAAKKSKPKAAAS